MISMNTTFDIKHCETQCDQVDFNNIALERCSLITYLSWIMMMVNGKRKALSRLAELNDPAIWCSTGQAIFEGIGMPTRWWCEPVPSETT